MARTARPGERPVGQSLISPQQTSRWNEQAPVRSQARRVQPGQAQSQVPTIACTRCRCWVHSRPAWAGAPQGRQQLTGQTHPFGMAIGPRPWPVWATGRTWTWGRMYRSTTSCFSPLHSFSGAAPTGSAEVGLAGDQAPW